MAPHTMETSMNAPTLDQALLAALQAELGPQAVLVGADGPQRNHNDYSGLQPSRPLAVLRPADTDGVAAALRLCQQHGVAVVVTLRADIGRAMLCGAVELADMGKQLGKQPGIQVPKPVGHLPAVALGHNIKG